MGRDAIVEAVLRRREDIAFLVCEELLDRVRLLDVRHEPVHDEYASLPNTSCPRAVLTCRSWDP